MTKFLIFYVFLIFSLNGYSQNSFLDNRNYVVVSGLANIPLLSGAFNETNYSYSNGELVERKDWIDYGASFAYHYVFSDKIMLGAEAVWRNYEVFSDRVLKSDFTSSVIGSYERTTDFRVENAQLSSWSFLPILTFTSSGSIIGDGIMHEVGMGYSNTKIRNIGYHYSTNEFQESPDTWTASDIYYLDTEWPSINSMTFKYGISLTVPVSKHFLFKIGSDSFINIYFKPDFETIADNKVGLFNLEDLYYNSVRENAFTWNLKIGGAFTF